MRVALLCGPCPPGQCGVGDYTVRLANALRDKGINAYIVSSLETGPFAASKSKRRLRNANFDIVHLQYPTLGFGWNLLPQKLSLLVSCVVTIHEVSGAHLLRKLSLLPFSIRSPRLVFTSGFEREFANRWVPRTIPLSCVIPIASNIDRFTGEFERRLDEVIYFGLITPKKGIEQVIALGEIIKKSGFPLRIRMVGSTPLRHSSYFDRVRLSASDLPIIWDCDLSPEDAARRLSQSSIAYLPFPDGASERRASLKAALLNGVVVVTTQGWHTPESLEGVVRFCGNPCEAWSTIQSLIDNRDARLELSEKSRRYAQPFSWEQIADSHVRLYQNLLTSKADRDQPATFRPATDSAKSWCAPQKRNF